MKLYKFLVCLILVSASPQANAAGEGLKNSGASVNEGGWNSEKHSTESFRVFQKLQGKLRKFDYYYQLRVVPQMEPTFANCKGKGSKILDAFFGTSEMKTILVRMGAQLRITTSESAKLFEGKQVPLLFAGFNKNSEGAAKKGCFFEPTATQSLTLSRFDGSDASENKEDYVITISAESSEELEFAIVKRVKELFVSFNTAFSWTQIAAGKVDAFEKAATEFETAINTASDQFNKYSKEFTLEASQSKAGRLVVTVPKFVAESSGTIVLYISTAASLIIDKKLEKSEKLTPSEVLNGRSLMTRQCAKEVLEAKECKRKKETVYEGLANYLSADAPLLFDIFTEAGRKTVYERCTKLRYYGTNKLELSTIDALLVRWAALHYFKVPTILNDEAQLNKLAAENGVPPSALREACWTNDDDEKLSGFVKAMNYSL